MDPNFTQLVTNFLIPIIEYLDPSGTMIQYDAKGMGAADEGILSLLKEKYKKEMSLKRGEKLAINILK